MTVLDFGRVALVKEIATPIRNGCLTRLGGKEPSKLGATLPQRRPRQAARYEMTILDFGRVALVKQIATPIRNWLLNPARRKRTQQAGRYAATKKTASSCALRNDGFGFRPGCAGERDCYTYTELAA
jgi:hypothetical protein